MPTNNHQVTPEQQRAWDDYQAALKAHREAAKHPEMSQKDDPVSQKDDFGKCPSAIHPFYP